MIAVAPFAHHDPQAEQLRAGRDLAKNNAEQVAKIRRICEELSLEIATPDEAREILDLKGGDMVAF